MDAGVPAPTGAVAVRPGLAQSILVLIRPHQWLKNVFVLLGPLFGLRDLGEKAWPQVLVHALVAAGVFALASSACYVFNDLRDVEADRLHPRKRRRPLASGAVSVSQAWVTILVLLAGAGGLAMLLPSEGRLAACLMVVLYVVNVMLYSASLKHMVIGDVLSLSLGFVLRVVGGCFAVGIAPSTWLLNCTLFVAMFLAFSKRLGERRTAQSAGVEAAKLRSVQARYTDELLRMSVVVTAVGALLTYAAYVQSREVTIEETAGGVGLWLASLGFPTTMNWMWLTILPATFVLLRSMVLVEKGEFDDPTEMVLHDRPLLVAGLLYAALTGLIVVGPVLLG